jgi:hypothetical protein
VTAGDSPRRCAASVNASSDQPCNGTPWASPSSSSRSRSSCSPAAPTLSFGIAVEDAARKSDVRLAPKRGLPYTALPGMTNGNPISESLWDVVAGMLHPVCLPDRAPKPQGGAAGVLAYSLQAYLTTESVAQLPGLQPCTEIIWLFKLGARAHATQLLDPMPRMASCEARGRRGWQEALAMVTTLTMQWPPLARSSPQVRELSKKLLGSWWAAMQGLVRKREGLLDFRTQHLLSQSYASWHCSLDCLRCLLLLGPH